jgi:hypothetical protein
MLLFFYYEWREEHAPLIEYFKWSSVYPLDIRVTAPSVERVRGLLSGLLASPNVALSTNTDANHAAIRIPLPVYDVVTKEGVGTGRALFRDGGWLHWEDAPLPVELVNKDAPIGSLTPYDVEEKYWSVEPAHVASLPEGWRAYMRSRVVSERADHDGWMDLLYKAASKGVVPACVELLRWYRLSPHAEMKPTHVLLLYSLIKKWDEWNRVEENVPTGVWIEDGYQDAVLYEMAIVCFYKMVDRKDALLGLFSAFLSSVKAESLVLYNMLFYCDYVSEASKINVPVPYWRDEHGDYISSSSSIQPLDNNQLLVNVRTVNYRIRDKHRYISMEKGAVNEWCPLIHTVNQRVVLDATTLAVITEPAIMGEESLQPLHNGEDRIVGIEDVRIYRKKDRMYFYGCTKSYSDANRNLRILHGTYDADNKAFTDVVSLPSVDGRYCEKNWTFFSLPSDGEDEFHFIYDWHPLVRVTWNRREYRRETVASPKCFHLFRGSTAGVYWRGMLWTITHAVVQPSFSGHREYIHFMVCLDTDCHTLAVSTPFRFEGNCIEYCVGMDIGEDGEVTMCYSVHDSTSQIIRVRMEYFLNRMCFIDRERFYKLLFLNIAPQDRSR